MGSISHIPSRSSPTPHSERAMADKDPDTILIPISSGRFKTMTRLPDGSYADRVAVSAGAGLVTDESGKYTFDLGSLASRFRYDSDGNQIAATYGPDAQGRFIRQTSTWEDGRLVAESAWFLVDSLEAP